MEENEKIHKAKMKSKLVKVTELYHVWGKRAIIAGLIHALFFIFTMETTNMNKALIRNSQLVMRLKPKRLLIALNVSSNENSPRRQSREFSQEASFQAGFDPR